MPKECETCHGQGKTMGLGMLEKACESGQVKLSLTEKTTQNG